MALEVRPRFQLANNKERTTEQLQKAKDKLTEELNKQQIKAKYIQKFALETKINQSPSNKENVAEEISEMSHMFGEKITVDKKTSDISKTNLTLIETLKETSVLSGVSRVTEVTEDNDCIRQWEAQIIPDAKLPSIIIKQKFLTKETSSGEGNLPSIIDLELSVLGVETDELDGVMNNCREWKEIQLFTRIVKEFVGLYDERRTILDKVKEGDSELYEIKDNVVTIHSSDGEILGLFSMPLEFNYRIMAWITEEKKLVWHCKFTELGEEAARTMNFPSAVLETGTTKNWTASEAVSNLMKLASFYTATPSPEKTPARPGKVDKRKLEL